MAKKAIQSKTLWVADAITIVGIIQTALPELQGIIPADVHVPQWVFGVITFVLGITVRILRVLFTTEAIARKTNEGGGEVGAEDADNQAR